MQFATEADLCATFISAIDDDWTAYPETAGFDILLVRGDGLQVGVEAKLRLNAKVLAQAMEDRAYWSLQPGPDHRAVLVPDGRDTGLSGIAAALGITVITCRHRDEESRGRGPYYPNLPTAKYEQQVPDSQWHDLLVEARCKLPEYVPDVRSGASAPVKLSAWKIKALKLGIVLERRGYVMRSDFRHLGMDHRRWICPITGWLQIGEQGWERGPGLPDLKRQHPRVWNEVEADAEKWWPPEPVPLARQMVLGE